MVQEELGVPVVAQNKVGGSGVVAMTYVKNSAPDGYTIGYLPCELGHGQGPGPDRGDRALLPST